MRREVWLVVFCLPFLLTGCVEVEMKVTSLGKVTQTFTATVPQRATSVIKSAAQNYLGRNWRVAAERKGEMNIVRIWRSYSSKAETKPMPGLVTEFRRRNGWFRATYELRIKYNPTDLFQTKDEQLVAANRKVKLRVFMPGRILADQSNATSVSGNMAELDVDPLQPAEVRIVAIGFIWWRIGALLLLVAFFVWLVAPYIPRIVEKFRRPTVKVVQR